jgi:hypothetical protein
MNGSTTRLRGAAPLLAARAVSLPAVADTGGTDRWVFTLEPYLWLPAANLRVDTTVPGLRRPGDTGPRSIDVNAETGPNNYLDELQMGLMLIGEARRGRWSAFTDLIYVDFGEQGSRARSVSGPLGERSADLQTRAETDLSTTAWTLAGGYRVAKTPMASLDLFAGFRYLAMDSSLRLTLRDASGRFSRADSISTDQSVWDGIVGARGRLALNDRWFVPYYADIGAGDSDWTWQAMLGVGYGFNWGDVALAVRSLSYEFDDNDVDLRMTGPALGVAFRW